MFIDLKTVKIGLVIAAAIFCLIGLVWNLNDFVVNLLAGIVGLSLGILIALSIVDKAVEELEDAQWIKIRDSTYKSTYNDLSLIAFFISIKMPIAGLTSKESYDPTEIRIDNEKLLAELPTELEKLIKLISQMISSNVYDITTDDGLGVTDGDVKRILVTAFEDIKPVLNGMRYIRIPRIMQVSKDQEIKDALIEFDENIDVYYYHMSRFNREKCDISRAIGTAKSMKNLIDKASQLSALLNARIDNTTDTR